MLGLSEEIIIVTMPSIPGFRITKILGPISGITVRSRGVGGKIVAGVEGFFGGEITMYSAECERARQESLDRLVERAKELGVNAILGADFETSDIMQGTATVFAAYGTAVMIEPIEGSNPIIFEAGYKKEFAVSKARLTCPSCKAVYFYHPQDIIKNTATCQNCGKQFEVDNQ